jgi:alkanesulfonate monooxygenase SsuD/methylene tetrahydromethanopterin reductase-like flavin-dependent oxidoreductase (luciferase family)
MKSRMKIGVVLPSPPVQHRDRLDLAAAARHAEDVGLDSVWHGDQLAVAMPTVDCTVALAVAATATTRIGIGASVFIPAIRPLIWAAKQVASLQLVSDGRLLLGIGSGGGAAQWAAAGVAFGERGPRTDTALRSLPGLLAGEPVTLPAGSTVALSPAVAVPPLWVGNASTVAIDRAARLGDGWFPSLITPAMLAAGRARLQAVAGAAGRPEPAVAVGAAGALGDASGTPSRTELAAGLADAYRHTARDAEELPVTGGPDEAAERIARYAAQGADHLVIGLSGPDWRTQVDLLAEVRTALGHC